jgi:paired amphipathic helix protein Sin3a
MKQCMKKNVTLHFEEIFFLTNKYRKQPQKTNEKANITSSSPFKTQSHLEQARDFVNKIRIRFSEKPEIHSSFLNILQTFQSEQSSPQEVYQQVAELFQNQTDLLHEFSQFLPESEIIRASSQNSTGKKGIPPSSPFTSHHSRGNTSQSTTAKTSPIRSVSRQQSSLRVSSPPSPRKQKRDSEPIAASGRQKRPRREEETDTTTTQKTRNAKNFFLQFQRKLNDDESYRAILKTIHLANTGVLSPSEMTVLLQDQLRSRPEMYQRLKVYFGFYPPQSETQNTSEEARIGPSYRAVSPNKGTARCSGRTLLCDQTLNNQWVSFPQGSEDVGFKTGRKNLFEEEMFCCEDQRYELDLAISLNISAIRALQNIQTRLADCNQSEKPRLADNELSIMHIRAIEKLYGDRSTEIIEGLYSNPLTAVPIVLNRLHQKSNEWKKCRSAFEAMWREVGLRNHVRAQDHQGTYFKQAEKRLLNPKVLFAEIKKKQQEQFQGLLQTPVHLSYWMSTGSSLHHIINAIIFAAEHNLSKSVSYEIEMFFDRFVLPYFIPQWDTGSVWPLVDSKGKGEATTPSSIQSEKDEVVTNEEVPTTSGRQQRPQQLPILYGNTKLYTFFRLFQIMSERLRFAIEKEALNDGLVVADRIVDFFKKVYEVMSGTIDQSRFEDICRDFFGINGYVLYTYDKVALQIARQIQSIIEDEVSLLLIRLRVQFNENQSAYAFECFEAIGAEKAFCFEFHRNPNMDEVSLFAMSLF